MSKEISQTRTIADLLYGRGKDDFETTESFLLLFRSWRLFGFIPKKPKRISEIFRQLFFWTCMVGCPYVYYAGLLATMKDSPITLLLQNLGIAINCMALVLKSLYIKINIDRLQDVGPNFKRLDDRYQRPQDQLQIRDSVKACSRLYGIFFIIYWLHGVVSWLVSIIAPEYQHSSYFPIIDWLPESKFKFWLHFVAEVIYLQFLLQINVMNDAFPPIYIRALRTHINLLTDRVSRLGSNLALNDQENFEELVDCIVTHQEVVKISNIVGSILSITTFVQFTVYAILVSVCMLNMFVFGGATTKLLTVSYIVPVLWETIPTCYQASMLESDCAKLPVAIFHCNWLELDKRCHKLIIYFMQRTQEEISFTAIKLFKICLGTNLSIAKFSFTLYTFINEMGFGDTFKDQVEQSELFNN